MFDLIIRGGTVYDGSGRPGIQADVAVSGGTCPWTASARTTPPGPPGSSTPGAGG